MKLVVIESPYAGANATKHEMHLAYGRACLADSLSRGESPIASHLLLTQPGVLQDNDPAQRSLGIAAGHAWMAVADLVAVYTDHGITHGMNKGIDLAMTIGCPVERRTLFTTPKPGPAA